MGIGWSGFSLFLAPPCTPADWENWTREPLILRESSAVRVCVDRGGFKVGQAGAPVPTSYFEKKKYYMSILSP
jgi:hypothetical protein